jgi:hypothetical protein
MLTNLAEVDSSPDQRVYSVGIRNSNGTALAERERPTWRDRSSTDKTIAWPALDGNSFKVGEMRHERHVARAQAVATSVQMNVLEVVGPVIQCEAFLPTRSATIQLPRGLFPVEPHFGMAFELSITEEGGIRRPVITVSGGDANALADMKAEMARMIAEM